MAIAGDVKGSGLLGFAMRCGSRKRSGQANHPHLIKPANPSNLNRENPSVICYLTWMKVLRCFFLAAFLSLQAEAQDELVLSPELLQQAEEWVAENIDESVLDSLGVDKDRTRELLTQLQSGFAGTNIYQLSDLRETAQVLLPLLQVHEEAEPYLSWLRTHFDYFDAADALRPEGETNRVPKKPLPSPAAPKQRAVWKKIAEKRPVPPAAEKYLANLKRIFIEEKVPAELVWIAEVESSFDTRAKSPAGAAGLFQLMPATARGFDLSVNMLRDERLHPEKNARVAARYLRRLYQRFGDWRLAFAAYNAGETRVAGLLRKRKTTSFDAIAGDLPAETQMYVPKIEATVWKRENMALADLRMPKV